MKDIEDLVAILAGYLPPTKTLLLMTVSRGLRRSIPQAWKHPNFVLSEQGAREITSEYIALFKCAFTVSFECSREQCNERSVWFDSLLVAKKQHGVNLTYLKIRSGDDYEMESVVSALSPINNLCLIASGNTICTDTKIGRAHV